MILSFISPTSTSEAPPTLITPTPPFNLASLSLNFSLSYSEVAISNYYSICSHLSSIAAFVPIPCIIIVSSLVTTTYLHYPRTVNSDFSSVNPISSLTTVAPVRTAISFKIAFLLPPNAGALTAQTLSPPLSLFTISYASASLSQSSQTNSTGLLSLTLCSKKWRIDYKFVIFFSVNKMYGFSNSTF